MTDNIQATISGKVTSSNSKTAFELFEKSRFGERKGEKIVYMPEEAFYLFEDKKLDLHSKIKQLTEKEIIKNLEKIDKDFLIKYAAFRDLRKKGYIVKSALKFGTDFRIYEKGKSIAEDHAKWLLTVFSERDSLKLRDLAAKNRVAHSTKKKLLIAIVDHEQDVSYYESEWVAI